MKKNLRKETGVIDASVWTAFYDDLEIKQQALCDWDTASCHIRSDTEDIQIKNPL